MQPPWDQLVRFRRLFLDHRPPHQAWMQPPGAASKYRLKFHAVTATEIAAHLAGRITLAVPLIGCDGTARAVALEIDADGDVAIQRTLAAAMRLGYTAFGIVCAGGTSGHNGGHVWVLFDHAVAPDRLRQVADDVAAVAGVAAETYPTRKALRLPLGVHRWTGRRGHLVLLDGQTIDLDTGIPGIAEALTVLDDLPRNAISRLPPPTPAIPPAPASQRAQDGLDDVRFSIARDNQGTGRVAQHYRNGGALLACPYGGHADGNATPSLEVQPATRRRYGRFVALVYAPGCVFFTEHGQVIDAFGVFCRLEHLTPAEAMRRLVADRQATRSGAGEVPLQAPPAEQQCAFGAEGGRP